MAELQAKMPNNNLPLPEEAMHRIFSNLPIKTILQCMCVCKSWQSLIKSPAFISTSSIKHPNLFLLHTPFFNNRGYSLHFDDKDFTKYMELDSPPVIFSQSYYHVIASCNGLAALTCDNHNYVLWNPCIRKYLVLPKPKFTYKSHGSSHVFLGLGYDSRLNDYKLLRFLSFGKSNRAPRVEVFSLTAGSWKNVSSVAPRYDVDIDFSQAFVNGNIYWLASKNRHEVQMFCNVVLGFDAGNETFCEIMLPESLASTRIGDLSVMTYKESSIAVVHGFWSILMDGKCQVWVMAEDGGVRSWNKLFTVENEGIPLALRSSGEILSQKKSSLVSINLERAQMKSLGDFDLLYHCSLSTHKESLALLDKGYDIGDVEYAKHVARSRLDSSEMLRMIAIALVLLSLPIAVIVLFSRH